MVRVWDQGDGRTAYAHFWSFNHENANPESRHPFHDNIYDLDRQAKGAVIKTKTINTIWSITSGAPARP